MCNVYWKGNIFVLLRKNILYNLAICVNLEYFFPFMEQRITFELNNENGKVLFNTVTLSHLLSMGKILSEAYKNGGSREKFHE